MKEEPRIEKKIEDFDDNALQPKGELGRYEFKYAEIKELPFEDGVLLYSQGENGVGIKRGLIIGWKKGEPFPKDNGGSIRKIQSLSKEERESAKTTFKDVLVGPIDFW